MYVYVTYKHTTPSCSYIHAYTHVLTHVLIIYNDYDNSMCFTIVTHPPTQGNIVLTDASYNVLTLLRSHRDDDKGLAIMARHPYPIHSIRYYQPITESMLVDAINAAGPKDTWRGVV